MLNELNKNHMGGFENYGQEELYNIDDAWENTNHDIKPKVRKIMPLHISINYKNKLCVLVLCY